MADPVRALAAMLSRPGRVVVFTGAGISTESGIPDFRSPGGLWSRYQPIDFSDFLSSHELRREAWRRKFATQPTLDAARPNRGHRAVAALVRSGAASAVITQNIDGLHQRSGVPDGQVIELHGNTTYARCLSCGARYELEPIRDAFERTAEPPACRCGGWIKTATISFGQPMPEEAMVRARREALAADLFLVLGSSLVVFPAAEFPALAKQRGADLVIVNREPTHLDPVADLVVHGEIGPILGDALQVA
jgi:NAD-dependent deacetylase